MRPKRFRHDDVSITVRVGADRGSPGILRRLGAGWSDRVALVPGRKSNRQHGLAGTDHGWRTGEGTSASVRDDDGRRIHAGVDGNQEGPAGAVVPDIRHRVSRASNRGRTLAEARLPCAVTRPGASGSRGSGLNGIVVPQDSPADPITGPGDRISVVGHLESQVPDDLSSPWTRISDPGDTKSELFQKNREPGGWETQTDLQRQLILSSNDPNSQQSSPCGNKNGKNRSKTRACCCPLDRMSTRSIPTTMWESHASSANASIDHDARFSAEMSIRDVKIDREGDLALVTAGL